MDSLFARSSRSEKALENDEIRMTNVERISKHQCPNGPSLFAVLCLRHWDFGFVSSLGIRHSSFITQRFHWIDSCRAAGGDVAGDTGNGSEGQQDADESPNVTGFDLIQQTLQIVGEYQRSDYS